MGRPTVYTDEAAEEILRRLAEGESLTRICRDDHLPCRDTVRLWVRGKADAPESFSGDYAQAREWQAEVFFEDVIDLARDSHEAPEPAQIQATKLLTDNMKWVLGRMDRAKYGEKSAHEISGPGGGELRFSWRDAPASPSPESTTEED